MTSPTKRWSLTSTSCGQPSTASKDWDFSPSSMWKISSSILHLTVKQEAFSISGLVKICCQQSRDILRPHLGKPVWLVSARVPLLNVRLSLFPFNMASKASRQFHLLTWIVRRSQSMGFVNIFYVQKAFNKKQTPGLLGRQSLAACTGDTWRCLALLSNVTVTWQLV